MANLCQGSMGPEVRTLQTELNRQLFPRPNLAVDGIFGPLTRAAVVAFQRQSGLVADGIVGPRTRAALGMPAPGNPFTHAISLHFRSLTLTDVPFNTILSSTQAVYAQFGIRVDFGSGLSLGLSQAEADRFSQIDGQCKWTAAGEFLDVQELGGPIPSGGIGVFFVDRFQQALNGCGGHAPNKPACIVAKAGTNFCTAHEVCHILLTSGFAPVHIDQATNLMHSVDLQRAAVPTLTQAQIEQVKRSPFCRRI
jgi:hypothetical protein